MAEKIGESAHESINLGEEFPGFSLEIVTPEKDNFSAMLSCVRQAERPNK